MENGSIIISEDKVTFEGVAFPTGVGPKITLREGAKAEFIRCTFFGEHEAA